MGSSPLQPPCPTGMLILGSSPPLLEVRAEMLPVVPLLLLCPFMRGCAKLNPQPVPPAAVWGPQIQRGGGLLCRRPIL